MQNLIKIPLWPARLIVLLLLMFASFFTYLVFFEPPWLSYTEGPFMVLNSPVKRGEVIDLKVDRCSTATVSRTYGLSRRLECKDEQSGKITVLPIPPATKDMQPGCYQIISRETSVPTTAPLGWCRLRGNAETQGVVRTHSVEFESKWFEVIP